MNVNYAFPLWTVVLATIGFLFSAGLTLVNMFYTQRETKTVLNAVLLRLDNQDKILTLFQNEIEGKFEKHKEGTDGNYRELNKTLIETRTYVKLLVENKIKP